MKPDTTVNTPQADQEQEKERLFTLEEMCTLLKVDRRTMFDWVQYRKIPYVKVDGKLVRFRMSEVAEWVQRNQRAHRAKFHFQ
jgi:excisionase family DNA binding protein